MEDCVDAADVFAGFARFMCRLFPQHKQKKSSLSSGMVVWFPHAGHFPVLLSIASFSFTDIHGLVVIVNICIGAVCRQKVPDSFIVLIGRIDISAPQKCVDLDPVL